MARVEKPKVSGEAKPFFAEDEPHCSRSPRARTSRPGVIMPSFACSLTRALRVSGLADLRFHPTSDRETAVFLDQGRLKGAAQGGRDLVGSHRPVSTFSDSFARLSAALAFVLSNHGASRAPSACQTWRNTDDPIDAASANTTRVLPSMISLPKSRSTDRLGSDLQIRHRGSSGTPMITLSGGPQAQQILWLLLSLGSL